MAGRMKWLIAALALFLGIALLASGQGIPVADIARVEPALAQATLPSGGESTLTLRLFVFPGWHINSSHQSDDLIPTELVLFPPEGINMDPIWPEPEQVKVSFSQEPLLLYRGEVEVRVRLTAKTGAAIGSYSIQGELRYQACSDEICLPPAKADFRVPVVIIPPQGTSPAAVALGGDHSGGGKFLWMLLSAFLLGLGLNLTPCVYPMIPIAVAYFARRSGDRIMMTVVLALAYQFGIALTYSALGVTAALSGGMLGGLLQHAWMLALAAGLIAVFATSFLGLWHLRPPAMLVRRLPRGRSGPILGAALMGGFVGVVAAPCVGPVTASLFSYVVTSQDVLRGWALFFVLSLGLGAPYVILALLGRRLKHLPKAGPWGTWVERILGVILLGVSWYLVSPLLPSRVWSWGAAALATGGAVYLFVVGRGITGRIFRILRWAVTLSGLVLAGVFLLSLGEASPGLTWTAYAPSVLAKAREQGRPVLLYFSADWCLPCKELSVTTFRDPMVLSATAEITLVKVDLTTAASGTTEKLRQDLGLVGVPTLIILGKEGQELWRNMGYITAADLTEALEKSVLFVH